jgi:hypothetical protein
MSVQQQNEISVEKTSLAKTSENNTQLSSTPPSKLSDVILAIHTEIEKLKLLRLEVKNDLRRPSRKLSTELYITQQILQALKNLLLALKEYNVNIKGEISEEIVTVNVTENEDEILSKAASILDRKAKSSSIHGETSL